MNVVGRVIDYGLVADGRLVVGVCGWVMVRCESEFILGLF
jgi:hypothetical protein